MTHPTPYWQAPRTKTARRRRREGRATVSVMGEGPWIRPLAPGERVQELWSRRSGVCRTITLRNRPVGIDRLINQMFIQPGSPLCN